MKLALVTAGAKRIGAAISERLIAEGYALAIHGRGDDPPEPALARAIAAAEARCQQFRADFTDPAAADRLWDEVARAFGAPPSLLVNNASLFRATEDDGDSAIERYFAVNTAAPVRLARRLAAAGGGVVINILDQRIAQPSGDQIAYTLSKMALGEATRLLARALAPNTRVIGVAPGLTLPAPDYQPGQLDRLASEMPLNRLPTPRDIADAVVWAANAGAVTGQTIFVDAGAHMRAFPRDFVHLARE